MALARVVPAAWLARARHGDESESHRLRMLRSGRVVGLHILHRRARQIRQGRGLLDAARQHELGAHLLELRHDKGLLRRRRVTVALPGVVDAALRRLGQLDAGLPIGHVAHRLVLRVGRVRDLLGLLPVHVANHGRDGRRWAGLAAVAEGRDDVRGDDLRHLADRAGAHQHDVAALPSVLRQLAGVGHAALCSVLVDLPEVLGGGALLAAGLVRGPVHRDLARALQVRDLAGAKGEVRLREVVHAVLRPANVILGEEDVPGPGAVGLRHGSCWKLLALGPRAKRGGACDL
mmetsp:Transcript_76031/g.105070  ORF Transcript_76031/g.105070 Transcript_76031/m.105070 type:complete len:290 (+) Transcript_76031:53-922(+)